MDDSWDSFGWAEVGGAEVEEGRAEVEQGGAGWRKAGQRLSKAGQGGGRWGRGEDAARYIRTKSEMTALSLL